MNRARLGLMCLALTLAAGCFASERRNLFGSRADRLELIEVTVENTEIRDVDVWAHWEGRSTRVWLGVVSGSSTRTFETPWRTHGVRFVDSNARSYYPVRPGDHLRLVVGGATSMIPQRVSP